MDFFSVPRIVLGAGSIEFLSSLTQGRTLFVAETGRVPRAAVEDALEQRTRGGSEVDLLEVGERPPTPTQALDSARRARESKAEFVVGLGGPSALDLAKLTAVLAAHPELDTEGLGPLGDLSEGSRLPLALIPAGPAGGAEMSWTCTLSNGPGAPLTERMNRSLLADWAILDPTLAEALGRGSLALGAAECVALSIESLSSEWSSPFSQALALGALRQLLPWSDRMGPFEDRVEAPQTVLEATALAGVACAQTGSGLARDLARVLSPRIDRPPGLLLPLLLPGVLEFEFPAARERLRPAQDLLGGPALQSPRELASSLRSIFQRMGIPEGLQQLGGSPVPASPPSGLSELLQALENEPGRIGSGRVPTRGELERLVRSAWEGVPFGD